MEDMDLKQERRYCSRIGAALFFVLIWTSAWQYGIIALDVYVLPVRMPDTLYYALILVGGYAVSLPAAFRICKDMPPMPFCKELPRARTFVRWAVIGFALMWIGSLIGNAVTDLVGLATGRAPAPIVDDMVNAMPLPARTAVRGAAVPRSGRRTARALRTGARRLCFRPAVCAVPRQSGAVFLCVPARSAARLCVLPHRSAARFGRAAHGAELFRGGRVAAAA